MRGEHAVVAADLEELLGLDELAVGVTEDVGEVVGADAGMRRLEPGDFRPNLVDANLADDGLPLHRPHDTPVHRYQRSGPDRTGRGPSCAEPEADRTRARGSLRRLPWAVGSGCDFPLAPRWRTTVPAAGRYEPLLDRYTDHLRAVRNLAPSTIANSRHYVACFLDWWRREHPDRVEVYSPAEMAAVLAHTASLTDLRGRQRHAIIATLRWTGCRAGEVSASLPSPNLWPGCWARSWRRSGPSFPTRPTCS